MEVDLARCTIRVVSGGVTARGVRDAVARAGGELADMRVLRVCGDREAFGRSVGCENGRRALRYVDTVLAAETTPFCESTEAALREIGFRQEEEGGWVRRNRCRTWTAVVAFDGGLGNRLFQAAFALGCVRRKPVDAAFAFCRTREITHHSSRTYGELFDRFPADRGVVVEDENEDVDLYYTEDPAGEKRYDPRAQDAPGRMKFAFGDDGMRVLYRGRFANPKYFEHCREELLSILRPEPPEIAAKLDATGVPWDRVAFVHVRLGDFVGDDRYWDPAALSAFYEASLEDLARRLQGCGYVPSVLVFSDGDVRKHYPTLHARIEAWGMKTADVAEADELVAFYAMARCGLGGIVPNSTFSWWAAFVGGKRCYTFACKGQKFWIDAVPG